MLIRILLRPVRVATPVIILFILLLLIAMTWKKSLLLTTVLERMMVYFPERRLAMTPDAVGLDYRDVYLNTADGVTLHGWFFPPAQARWTILYLHGNGGNIADRLDDVRLLKQVGCQTLLIDYRGYGISTGEPDEQGLYRDAEAAYRWLIGDQGIAPHDIAVFGESLGGAVAIELAARVPVGALIVQSTFTSLRDMARHAYPAMPFGLLAGKRYPSLARIAHIDAPKLIIHGSQDETIPWQMGEVLYRAAAEPKWFFTVLGGHHNDVTAVGGPAYVSRLRFFLEAEAGVPVSTPE